MVDRVGDGDTDAGAALVGAAVVATGERDALALAAGLAEALAAEVGDALVPIVGLGLAAAVALGDGDADAPLSDAQARESLTPGADAQTDRAGVTHDDPSAAVRESATRTKG